MSEYFQHEFISNSDLKKFKQNLGVGRELPANLEAIFAFGTIFHKTILEPNLLTLEDRQHPDFANAERMSKIFWKDELCRSFIMASDFRREAEFYDTLEVQGMRIQSRAKADGYREKMKYLLELKGLNVHTEKAFNDALYNFDYDQGAAFYLLTSKCDLMLIAGISKKKDLMFKRIVKRFDDFYLSGEQKIIDALNQLKEFSPGDIELV